MSLRSARVRRSRSTRTKVGLACLGVFALVLSGCSSDEEPGDSPDSGSASAPAGKWSDWMSFDSSSVLGANDESFLLSTSSGRPAIHTRQGKLVAELPPVLDATFSPRVQVTPERIIAQFDDAAGTVAAFDWSGKKVWDLDPGTIDECAPGPYFSIRPSESMTQNISAGAPVLLNYQEQYADDGIVADIPDQCFDGSRADYSDATHVLALDPGTGKERWRVKDRVDEQVDGTSVDPTGRFLDRVVSSRGYPALVRTEIATGKSSAASVDPLAVGGDSALGSKYSIDHLDEDVFYLSPYGTEGGGEPAPVRVTKWRDVDAPPDPDAATGTDTEVLDPLPHGACRMSTWASESGYVYCLLPPGNGPDWRYSGGLVATPGTDAITPRTAPKDLNPWSLEAPQELKDVSAEDESLLFLGPDPVIARPRQAPLIVVPSGKNTAVAVDLTTGDEVWRSPDLGAVDPTTAAYVAQPTSVPTIGEVVVAHGEKLVGLDATTGEVAWSETVDGGVQMITHSNGVLAVKDSSGTARVRVVEGA